MPLYLLLACAAAPEGLRATPDGDGPMVVVDWDAEPLPELPFPNDLATRTDPGSPTGLRLNISTAAATDQEHEARVKLDELSGFGIFAPITVRFDQRLDLDGVLARHPDDFERGAAAFADDAIYLVDVDPDSPGYLSFAALDLGHGRFPMDVVRSDRYFPNDTRAESPSLMFDTVDEDLDGDGVLDWGEDTDNDGILDVANVWPPGGDPRDDLLSWYELSTDTLIARPVVPLREETTYAVVLTERLTDLEGAPVRSPWEWVHHTRQTEALRPALDALAGVGLGVDDLAFGWTFTTGRVTGDLVDIQRGLQGEGPWPSLGDSYPAGVQEALSVHARADADAWNLPVEVLIDELIGLGLFDEESADALAGSYLSFGDRVVGGAFTTPYLLSDRDDGGRDDSDEWWQLDPVAGTMSVAGQRVAFTCVLPQAADGFAQPFDVALFGHGYGSSRFDFLGFAHAMNRQGMAACAADFPGHGPTIDDDQLPLIEAVLGTSGLTPFLWHLQDSRYRDLNNDGVADSGGDQWSADPFHTRDMVRQAAVDFMQFTRSVRACGSGEMDFLETTADGAADSGLRGVACDWDGDGVADIGGAGARISIVGGSLGGINSAVAVPLIPDVAAWAPIVPGGGTLDIGVRTEIGGAVEALVGRLLSPLFLGYPTESGGLQIVQSVNSVTDMVELPVATLGSVPAGGRVEVENLRNGELRVGMIPADGRFRLGIPADGLDAAEKRAAAGIPDTGPEEGAVYEVAGNDGLGDPLVVRLYDADGALVAEIDAWEEAVLHEGVTMRAGSPLVAGSHGTGHIRGTPALRRLAMVLAAVLEPGDAISYAPHWFLDPYPELGGQAADVLLVPTIGDPIVNINTGIALGRAAGLVDWTAVDERYGSTVDQWLIDRRVVQGLAEHGPWTDDAGNAVLFDPDDLDDGTDGLGAPSDTPLRSTVDTSAGVSGMRLPYVSTTGSHGFGLPNPALPFDVNTFAITQISWYLATGELRDDACMADGSCDFLRPVVAR
jgi:hypothetical protein